MYIRKVVKRWYQETGLKGKAYTCDLAVPVKNGVNNQGIHYYYTLNRNDGLTHFDFTCTSIPKHPL
jgi:hypothetical protein